MSARVVHGSPEHFQQVIDAHVIGPSGNYCRCGASAANGYRAHIANVWRPYELPEDFLMDPEKELGLANALDEATSKD